MATFLDIGLLQGLGIIFPWLLIFCVVYGILVATKTFSERPALQSLLAFTAAMVTIFVPALRQVIEIMTPWFVVFFIFILLIIIIYKMFGATDAQFASALSPEKSTLIYWVLIISFIIFLGSLGKVFFTGQEPANVEVANGTITAEGETGQVGVSAFWSTLFHPKVLGAIMILMISVFALYFLTKVTPAK